MKMNTLTITKDNGVANVSMSNFDAFLKHGGQAEREALDFQGLFADTAIELAK